MAKKKTSKKVASFESSLETLKQIVADLENGNLTLGESLEKYEQGIGKLKECHAALAMVHKKIELLVDLDEDGNMLTRSFDHTQSTESGGQVRRESSVRTSVNDDFEEVDDRLDDEYSGELF